MEVDLIGTAILRTALITITLLLATPSLARMDVVPKHHARKNERKAFARPRYVLLKEGIASWYGPGFQGRRTSSGIIFNTYRRMCAMLHVPLHTDVLVVNQASHRSTRCTVLDHGPYVSGRIIDLSYAGKTDLGMGGLARVKVYALR